VGDPAFAVVGAGVGPGSIVVGVDDVVTGSESFGSSAPPPPEPPLPELFEAVVGDPEPVPPPEPDPPLPELLDAVVGDPDPEPPDPEPEPPDPEPEPPDPEPPEPLDPEPDPDPPEAVVGEPEPDPPEAEAPLLCAQRIVNVTTAATSFNRRLAFMSEARVPARTNGQPVCGCRHRSTERSKSNGPSRLLR
jgi:hypothetical protein